MLRFKISGLFMRMRGILQLALAYHCETAMIGQLVVAGTAEEDKVKVSEE